MPSLTEIGISLFILPVCWFKAAQKRTTASSKPPKGYGYKNFPNDSCFVVRPEVNPYDETV